MVIRLLTSELQEKAKNELGEDPSLIANDLDNIRQWLLTQNHLQCRTDDQWLLGFLRGCKFNMEKTKIKIDNFYRIRTLMPEFFKNRDPFQPDIQEFLKAGFLLPLPLTNGASGPRIIYTHYNGISHTKINCELLVKVYCMFMDVLILEDDNYTVAGLIGLTDCEAFPLSFLFQLTPNYLRKVVYSIQHCYPIRIAECRCVNAPLGFETLLNLMKSFMSIKLRSRFFIYGKKSSQELDQIFDKKYLPQQHGGMNGSTEELIEYWKNKIESYRDWFLEDEKYRSNENVRPKKGSFASIFSILGPLNPYKEM